MKAVVEKSFRGRVIRAEAALLAGGTEACVYGGDFPHIGAVSIAKTCGGCETKQFDTHRDGAVSEVWARELAKLRSPAVVTAGIHYDNITPKEIEELLELVNGVMLDNIKEKLTELK